MSAFKKAWLPDRRDQETTGWLVFYIHAYYTALHLGWWKRGESVVRVACAARPEFSSS